MKKSFNLQVFMVPKAGFEPARGLPTTPSRWRVYQIPPLRHIMKTHYIQKGPTCQTLFSRREMGQGQPAPPAAAARPFPRTS